MAEQLRPQDGLYTVLVRSPDGDAAQVNAAVRAVLPGTQQRAETVDRIASPAVRLVTLTVNGQTYLTYTNSQGQYFFFGTPAGDSRFDASSFPGWINFGAGRWYGMASHEPRGVKIADDVAGPPIDPTSLDRVISAEAVRTARAFLRRRFPALAAQPVVESRVCQYEYAPDANFLLDRHPTAENVWLAGGGSGHGFKMGPAVGEYVARLVVDHAAPDGQFTYAHFADGRRRGVSVASGSWRPPQRLTQSASARRPKAGFLKSSRGSI